MYLTYVFEFSNNSNKNAAKQEIIPLGGVDYNSILEFYSHSIVPEGLGVRS